jgi:WD40 repeat protein
MQCRALWLFIPVLLSCERLTNRLQSQVLDCGEAARAGGSWIKVLDPQGLELPDSEQLDARVLDVNADGDLPARLPVSEKHCVQTRSDARIVIRSLAQDRSWSALVQNAEDLPSQTLRLQDNSQSRVRLRCPEPWIQNGRFQLPLEITAPVSLDAWAFAPRLVSADGRETPQNFSLTAAQTTFLWPQSWPDGPGELVLKQKNFLQNPRSALAEGEESCPLIIDRNNPTIDLKPAPKPDQDLEMQPGSLLLLKISDPNPAELRWCLQAVEEAPCEKAEAWQTVRGEVSLPMPESGRWILMADARDAAGNAAPRLTQTIDIVRADLIQSISTRVDKALAEKNEKGWEASQSLLQALVDYQRLSIAKEKNQIRNKIVSGILETVSYFQEHQRATLPSPVQQAWTVNEGPESPWLVLADSSVSLWSAQGRQLDSQTVPLTYAADWSSSVQALALGTTEELWVVPVRDSRWAEPLRLRWMDYKDIKSEPDAMHWIPGTRQILLTFPSSEPAIIEWIDGTLSLTQRLDSLNSKFSAVAFDGSRIATVDGDNVVKVWDRKDGLWKLSATSDELSVAGLSFAKGSDSARLIVLLSDGRLISWSPGVLWKDMDAANGDIPTESKTDQRFPLVQAWGKGESGLIERGGRFYQWSTDPGKTLQPLKLSGFAWDELRSWKVDPCQQGVWLQDNRALSFWVWQAGSEAGFIKQGEWILGTTQLTDFAVRCDEQKKFLSWTGPRLRFWSQAGPLTLLPADQSQVVLSRFERGRGAVETLFTAGFDKMIRLWTTSGQKQQEWVGHTAQINELRFLPEWDLYLSSAEDATSRLWTADGQPAGTLSLSDEPAAKLRDAGLAFDERHILTAGQGKLAIWSRNSLRTELTITVSVARLERPGFDPMVRLPGDPRILVRLKKDQLVRAMVVRPDGSLAVEAGLPPLLNLKWLEWTKDGSRLGWSDAQRSTHIARHEGGQWREDVLPQNLSGLTRFAFSPDGISFAALRSGKALVLGRREGAQWSVRAEVPLASGSLDYGLHWSPDSSRLVYAQSSQVFIHDRDGQLLHQFQAFPGTDTLDSIGISQDPELMALGLKKSVRIVDLNLDRLQTQLCTWLDAWIHSPDASPEFSRLCMK